MSKAAIRKYLEAIHHTRECGGFEQICRLNKQDLPHLRTLYRWHRRLGDDLLFFPTFQLEALGLVHLHLFVPEPQLPWLRFPYAVEHLWLTENVFEPVLYLHCVVPAEHRERLDRMLDRLMENEPGGCIDRIWTRDGTQRLNIDGRQGREDSATILTPSPGGRSDVFNRDPLAIPVIFEAWNHSVRLADLWDRIRSRIWGAVPDWVPRDRFRYTKGPFYVRRTLQRLQAAGLFRQHWIRYTPFTEDALDFLICGQFTINNPEALVRSARLTEFHASSDGPSILRIVGTNDQLSAIQRGSQPIGSGSCRAFIVSQHETPDDTQPRFAYEHLFDPVRRRWIYSDRLVRQRLGLE